jgi:alpha-beta hydrolase superfamily lysophospholipase
LDICSGKNDRIFIESSCFRKFQIEILQFMTEQNWIAFDGLNLYATLWKPDVSPKAVVAFVHGHGTHSRRYEEWYFEYLKRGFAVITFDLRGHGRSGGKQGTIHRYNEYLEDVGLLMRKTRENFPHLPIVLYGHSMGATIVLSYLQTATNLPEMAVLASAWLELVQPPGKLKSLAIGLADSLLPQMTIKTGLKSGDFASTVMSEPPKERDPLMHKKISARCFSEVQRATKKIHAENLPSTVPMLFMHGTSDRVSAPDASEKLALGLPGRATFRDWEDGPHQLLDWEQAERVTDFTIDWINKHL